MRLVSRSNPLLFICLFAFVHKVSALPVNDACELPKDLQQAVSSKFPGRAVVRLSDLGDYDKEMFKKEHVDSCPGLVSVDFYGDGKPTLALALITKSVAQGKTELVVAREVGGIWETTTLEITDGGAPAVWSEKPGEYKGHLWGEKGPRYPSRHCLL